MIDTIVANLPVPLNETERLKALDSYNILDSLDEKEYDRITELAAIICDVPIALVSFIDEERQWYKSSIGLDVKEVPREHTFCQYAIMDTKPLEVEDATKDERFWGNEMVTGDAHIRFYASFPLIDDAGYVLGTLCVI